jgi:toxin ParE1/3/4
VQVSWTKLARSHLTTIYEYIRPENPSAALQQIHRIESAVDQLGQFPEAGRPGRVTGTRELVVPGTQYIVAYMISESSVRILAIHHGAQRWPQAFRHQQQK